MDNRSIYSVGDTLSIEHQNITFDYCYPYCDSAFEPDDCEDYADNTFSFADNSEKIFKSIGKLIN